MSICKYSELVLASFLFPLGKKTPLVALLPKPKLITFAKKTLKKQGLHYLDAAYSFAEYHSSLELQKVIWDCKYGRNRSNAQVLASWVGSEFFFIPNYSQYSLVPVPLHFLRLLWRTFNQAYALAFSFHQRLSVPLYPCIRRIRYTATQVHRNRQERFSAMDGAFIAYGKVPSHAMICDDVWTTGATLDACAKVLKSAGATRVVAVTVAYAKHAKL